ncbi:MAG: MtnX-like HAD-IB family phosphatase [Candidatus Kapabacteria bacterium]|nr:MtnX-like HAD-IB family phosphatase [Ignavibacteriota bacterium]MCW5883560.1 MtnX-like HAD-IB family phosphatase [Candidatus Kapabacteria bacterium]
MINDKMIKIFCDFDGTITNKDLGDEIFKVFGEFEPYHTQLVSGVINIKEYWHRIVPTLNGNFPDDIKKLALESDVDPYFEKFLNLCSKYKYDAKIVSDGFSIYIEPLLEKYSLASNDIYCNKINFLEKPKPEFYGASESCNCLSASCKRNVVLTNSKDEEITVFIGDGYSDFCVAEHCDIIFAKKNLAAYCTKNRIPFYNYKTFFDIISIFEKMHKGKITFRKRRQAELKRKVAFETE